MSIAELQVTAHENNDLLVWTIYDHPRDCPDMFVVRPHSSKEGKPMNVWIEYPTLKEAREALFASGLYTEWIARPTDDPVIVESWI